MVTAEYKINKSSILIYKNNLIVYMYEDTRFPNYFSIPKDWRDDFDCLIQTNNFKIGSFIMNYENLEELIEEEFPFEGTVITGAVDINELNDKLSEG